ncbi:MAG: hypothetical protein KGH64_01345 [Candidatus Micrarchaeota archaeon]|nr:hypothetical protein [Candidatus Micrarchaeota archaeon]MDE1833962.1 hypothetical protein [Candidatus Micrarchaeota archaeon]MDE1859770.1 hypothetical protein [Candidatus Micrarchaeota archaeon]
MIVFGTSVAGSNRAAFMEGKVAQMAAKNGKRLKTINLVDVMLECASQLNRQITPSTLLSLDKKVLNVLKKNAMRKISEEVIKIQNGP